MPKRLTPFYCAWLLLCAVLPRPVFGTSTIVTPGSPFTVTVWSTEDGLPQNSVISMIQTRDGYLWLGTARGLARFDGVRFKMFGEGGPPELSSSPVVQLFEDRDTNLWVGTDAGVVLVTPNKSIRLSQIGQGPGAGQLAGVCEDAKGAVWLYTSDGQLWWYQNGRGTIWRFGAELSGGYRAIMAEKDGPLWIAAPGFEPPAQPNAGTSNAPANLIPMSWGLYGLNVATNSVSQQLPPPQFFVPVTNRLDFILASKRGGYWRLADGRVQQWRTNHMECDLGPYLWGDAKVNAACEDNDGNLVVGTEGPGVFWYDARGKAAVISAGQGLSHSTVLSVCVDREGDLWVGTDGGGLNRVRRQTFAVLQDTGDKTVQSVCEDGTGGLWIGTFGGGLKHWHEGRLEQVGADQGLANIYVRTVFLDRGQRLWVGADKWGLFQMQDGVLRQILLTERVTALTQDRRGSLWVGTDNGLVTWDGQNWGTLTTSNGLSANEVTAIAQDAEGDLWIGTARNSLNRVHEGKVTVYQKSQNRGLPSDSIASLLADNGSNLWAGTAGGLARLRGGQWTSYTSRDALPSDAIGYLLDDGRGDLWMGSYAGLMRVTKKALDKFGQPGSSLVPVRSYGQADGLLTRECTFGSQPAACRTPDGRLWFPTIKGLVSVDPARLLPNTNPPPVVIESVLINGLEADTNRAQAVRSPSLLSVTLPPGKERLEIQFTSLNLAAPDKARFRYRLEDYEQSENEASGNVRPVIARYPKLPPGYYEFHVTACNEDGVWNPAAAVLAVIVLPQFWQTWWFRGAVAVTLLALIVSAVHYVSTQRLQRQLASLRQREALEKERARIARDIHDQLGASLTQVALLGELVEADKHAPGEVEQHARQISETARETTLALDEIVWTVNPSNDTLDGLITYVCKYAQDYLTMAGVRQRVDVPTQLPGAVISPEVRHNVFLAAKEAVTNVVRHARATEVWIRLQLEAGRFALEIQDNGRGLGNPEEALRIRNGLRNMRKRLEDVGGTFFIGVAPEGGTLVRLAAPLAKA